MKSSSGRGILTEIVIGDINETRKIKCLKTELEEIKIKVGRIEKKEKQLINRSK